MLRAQTTSGVLLNSTEGQKLLQQSEEKNQSVFKSISQVFHKQDGESFCGYCTTACALSVLGVCGGVIREADLVADFGLANDVYEVEKAETNGMPLNVVSKIFKFFGCNDNLYHMSERSPEVLRESIGSCIPTDVSNGRKVQRVMIVNFWAPALGIHVGCGHFSLAVAYHEESDRMLVLDTYFESSWYSIEQMASAMNTIDADGNQYRGFVIAEKKENN